MKRIMITTLAVVTVLLLGNSLGLANVNILDNGDFTIDAPPRANHQGLGKEYIYGWRPFVGSAWLNKEIDHVSVIRNETGPSDNYLRLIGLDGSYVGLRSAHMDVKALEFYTLSAKAYVKELADPSRSQIWIEFWPANFQGENSSNRLQYSKAVNRKVGEWEDLEISTMAPADAATATVLVIIHTLGKPPLVPAEVYVADLRVRELD